MAKKKRTFEAYEEAALDIRTAIELLNWMQHICGKAWLCDRLYKVIWNLEKIKCKLEEEMFKDYPEQANLNVFYGDGAYTLNISKDRNYIFSSFDRGICKESDVIIALTKQGNILTSDDVKLTFEEKQYLMQLNRMLIARSKDVEWGS